MPKTASSRQELLRNWVKSYNNELQLSGDKVFCTVCSKMVRKTIISPFSFMLVRVLLNKERSILQEASKKSSKLII